MEFLAVFGVSMLPMEGVMDDYALGLALGLPVWLSYLAVVMGTLLPVPFLLVLLKEASEYLMKFGWYREKLTLPDRYVGIGRFVLGYREALLLIIMSIPLVLPGVWIGSILAIMFKISVKKAFLTITAGTIIAGLITVLASNSLAGI